MGFLDWFIIFISIVLTSLVALQDAKGDLSEAITGGNSELFKNQKERGADLFLSRTTLVLAVLFIILVFVTSVI